jgi:hypothetical protein
MSGTEGNVARIAERQPAGQVPVLRTGIQVDLGAGRVASLETYIPSDCTLPELNRLLDKMTAAGDRQRAHYMLEELNRDLLKQEKELVQAQVDFAQHKVVFGQTQAKRTADLERQQTVVVNYTTALSTDERKRGPVQPKGADKANLQRVTNAAEEMKKQIIDADLAFATECSNYENTIHTYEKAIERTKREIARCQEIEAAGLKG